MRRHARNLRRMRELRTQNMNVEALEYFGDVEDVYSSSDSEYERPRPVWTFNLPEGSDGEDGGLYELWNDDYDSDDPVIEYEFWSDPEANLNSEGEKINGVLSVEIPLPPGLPREFSDDL